MRALMTRRIMPRNSPKKKIIRIIRKPVLAAAIVFFVAGGLGALLADGPVFKVTALGIGIAACLVFLFFLFRHQTAEDYGELESVLQNARGFWRKETGENSEEDYEAFLARLDSALNKARDIAVNYERAIIHAADSEKEAASRTLEKKNADTIYETADREFRQILLDAGADDTADYAAKLADKENIDKQIAELEIKLLADRKNYLASSPEDLENILADKRRETGEKITQTAITDMELRAKENELRKKKAQLDILRNEEKQGIENHSIDFATVRERTAGLPEKIVAYENGILEKENRLHEIERELRASRIAQEIFESIAEDSDEMLGELSREVSVTFSSLTEEGRQANLKDYSVKTAGVTDSGGGEREKEFLSAGTRDAFVLAARLVLARKSGSGKKGHYDS